MLLDSHALFDLDISSVLDSGSGVVCTRTVRTGAGASVGVVAKLVDMEATFGVGVVAGDVPSDGGGSILGGLLEDHLAGDLGVSAEDGNCWVER